MIIKGKVDCKNTVDSVYDLLSTDMFPWYWNEFQIKGYEDNSGTMGQNAGFTHVLFVNNEVNSGHFYKIFDLINLILDKEQIKMKSIFRIQANLAPNITLTDEQMKNSIHTDMTENKYITLLYYVMDSDGDTVIFDDGKEVRINPKQGNYVIFNSNLNHRATMPVENKRRIAINCILEV